jgi:hypothetical protein
MGQRVDMNTIEPNRLRYASLVALFLLGSAIFATLCMNKSESRDRDHIGTGSGLYWISRRIVETPIFTFLPRWFLNRWAVSISRERNASVLENVFEVFDPSLRPFLTSVPIILDSSANTAKAYPAKGYIGVSPDWDNTVLQSEHGAIYEQRGMKPEDPVFIYRFKTSLLIHEYLHILQVHRGIDSRSFYEAFARWYTDPRYGAPNPNGMVNADKSKDGRPHTLAGNRIKYILWYQLYNSQSLSDVLLDEGWKNMQYVGRYRSAEKGVEEFAYIGEEILASGSGSEDYIKTRRWSDEDWQNKRMMLQELSPEVIALYRGVFNPKLTY